MNSLLVLVIVFVMMLCLIGARVPVAFAMMVSGGVGIVMLNGWKIAGLTLGSTPFSATLSYTLVLIPLYIIMGTFMLHSAIGTDLFNSAARALGKLPGGLGQAAVVACAIFGSVSGSSVATAVTIGRVSLLEMRRHGYSAGFAGAIIATGGTLGIIIPPSILIIIYGTLTGESIGELTIATIIPGILSIIPYMVAVAVMAKKNVKDEYKIDVPVEVPVAVAAGSVRGSKTDSVGGSVGLADGQASLATGLDAELQIKEEPRKPLGGAPFSLITTAVILVVVMGGIFSGLFTATESGAVGAFVAFAALVIRFAREGWRDLWQRTKVSLKETAESTGMIFVLLFGAGVFAYFIVIGGYAEDLGTWVVNMNLPPLLVVVGFLIILLPLGALMDELAMVLIMVPIMYPVISALGYDGVWFGVLIIKMCQIGLVLPPVGLNVFVVSGVAKLDAGAIFQKLTPFVIGDLVVVAVLVAFPDITLWLPSLSSAH
jgi:C4-dicarboxylate transporter DctM subunit